LEDEQLSLRRLQEAKLVVAITYHGAVKPAASNAVAKDLGHGKSGFKAAWAELRSRLTDEDIERFRRHETMAAKHST
jgi:hypothetical protein